MGTLVVKMPRIGKFVYFVLNFILGILCTLHIIIVIYYEFNPKLPIIERIEKDLHNIEFPLSFRFCVFDEKNYLNRYNQFGYANAPDFFTGQSKFNRSIVGWGGHTEDGYTLASVEGNSSALIWPSLCIFRDSFKCFT